MTSQRKPYWLSVIVLITIGSALGGIFLYGGTGGGFIFSYNHEYFLTMLPVFIALTPVCWLFFSRSKAAESRLKDQMPTKWVRFMLFPLIVVFSAGFIAFLPIGWFATYGWLMGSTEQTLSAQVVSIGSYVRGSKGCNQSAVLTVGEVTGRICMSNRIVGKPPKPGQNITVSARRSKIGYYISKVSSQSLTHHSSGTPNGAP